MRLHKGKDARRIEAAIERGDRYLFVKVGGYSGRMATLQLDEDGMAIELAAAGWRVICPMADCLVMERP